MGMALSLDRTIGGMALLLLRICALRAPPGKVQLHTPCIRLRVQPWLSDLRARARPQGSTNCIHGSLGGLTARRPRQACL